MSRSYKKTPVFGICGHPRRSSEKEDKRIANRIMRRWAKQELYEWGEEAELPILREASNVWNFKHDGKLYRNRIWDHELDAYYYFNTHRNFRHDDLRYRKIYKPADMRK